jgi:hypothetical protein
MKFRGQKAHPNRLRNPEIPESFLRKKDVNAGQLISGVAQPFPEITLPEAAAFQALPL